jgi:hypothetical protein
MFFGASRQWGRTLAIFLEVSVCIKTPGYPKIPGAISHKPYILMYIITFFSHPDYTVGFGIAPNQPHMRLADFTAGGESHSAPKTYPVFTGYYTTRAVKMQLFFWEAARAASFRVSFLPNAVCQSANLPLPTPKPAQYPR